MSGVLVRLRIRWLLFQAHVLMYIILPALHYTTKAVRWLEKRI